MVIIGVGYQAVPACCNQADAGVVNLFHIACIFQCDIFRADQHKYSRRLCGNRIWRVGTLEGS